MIEGRTDTGVRRLAESVVASGYSSIVLNRLTRQACELVDADRTCLLVRDRRAPGATIAVAGWGQDKSIVGDRFVGDGHLADILHSGDPHCCGPRRPGERRARVAVPVRHDGTVFGALTAGAQARRGFGDRDLAVLSGMAVLAGAAVAHAVQRSEILSRTRARVVALVEAIDARDGYTAAHTETVVELTRALGERLGLSPADLLELELAALFHDLGKLVVPDAILNKPAALDADEQAIMRRHADWGAAMLANVPGLQPIATIVRCHHERWDGSGYPSGIAGERIPIASRVVAVCDAYDAMTSDRCYRRALPQQAALAELRAGAGSQFDPALIELLPSVLSEHPRAARRSGPPARTPRPPRA